MSKPSAWNGRNESILGTSGAPPSKDDVKDPALDSSTSKSSTEKGASSSLPPKKNVWNGKHDKIMEIRDKSGKHSDAPTSSNGSNGSTTSNGTSLTSTSSNGTNSPSTVRDIRVAVVSPSPKGDDIKSSQNQAREDEGTTSTAGSSTTNLEDDPSEDVSSSFPTSPVPSEGKSLNDTSNNNRRSENGHSAQSGQNGSSLPADVDSSQRRNSASGGNHKGRSNGESGRGSGRHNGNGARGQGGNGRRKATNSDKPLCAFFIRGMCNRGLACAFRHDTASANTPAQQINGQSFKAGAAPSSTSSRFVPTRVFDPLKARAIQLSKEAQDKEDRSNFASPLKSSSGDGSEDPPFYSIDVECIATGYGSCAKGINDGCGNEGRNTPDVPCNQFNDLSHRYPGRVAMVDTDGNVVADIIIRPPHDGKGVVSYLTPLTGLTKEMCLGDDAKSLEEAVQIVKDLLPKSAVLVGQAIDHDVEWLGLTPGKDFDHMVDICEIFRQRIPKNLNEASDALRKLEESGAAQPDTQNAVSVENGAETEAPSSSSTPVDMSTDEYLGFATRYRSFSLRHVCLNLLGQDIQSGVHDPIIDAQFSLTLFHKYRNSGVTQLRIVRDGLHRAPVTPGFAAEKTPVIDGVCVSAAGYPYKRAARKIWRWYSSVKLGA